MNSLNLVGGLEHVFSHPLKIIIPTDFHIFQRGWNHQPDANLTGNARFTPKRWPSFPYSHCLGWNFLMCLFGKKTKVSWHYQPNAKSKALNSSLGYPPLYYQFFFLGVQYAFKKNTIFQKSSRQWVRVPGHAMGPGIKYHTKKGPDFFSWKLPDVQWQEINFCLLWLRGGWSISLCM